MKHILLAMLCAALLTFGGCAKNSAPAYRADKPSQQETRAEEEAGPQKVLTGKDLKIQTKSSPIKKYNDLSLGEARRSESAKKMGMSNNSRTSKGSSPYSSKNPI